MKKLMMILAGAALLATSAPAFAGNDRPIAVGELPAVSQEFIKTHFAGVEVPPSRRWTRSFSTRITRSYS